MPFTAPNYGTTTRSYVEFLFVLEPSKIAQKLKISAWPIEKKLAEDPKSKHLCRQLRYPKFFTEARQDISKRLRPLNLEFNGEMFLGHVSTRANGTRRLLIPPHTPQPSC